MNVFVSWAVFLAVLVAMSWYYAGRPNLLALYRSQKPSEQTSQKSQLANARRSRAKQGRGGAGNTNQREINPSDQSSSTGGTMSKKRKITMPQSNGIVNAYSSGSAQVADKGGSVLATNQDATDNADFAREMAVARAGTQFAGPGKPGMSKSSRLGRKQENLRPDYGTESSSLSAGASSTTEADADDDLWPVASPSLAATSTATYSRSGDVSDMLGVPVAGPSVLRLTDPTKPIPQARTKLPIKAANASETKKQRQHRIKRETQRAQVQEAERKRQSLMEKQIRGARMDEGTSAQTRTSAFMGPPQNAWLTASDQTSLDSVKAPSGGSTSLLDTFEPEPQQTTSMADEAQNAPAHSAINPSIPTGSRYPVGTEDKAVNGKREIELSALEKDGKGLGKDGPVEEGQMHVNGSGEADSWITVSKRDKKKPSKIYGRQENDTSEASGGESRPVNGSSPNIAAGSKPASSTISNIHHELGDSGLRDSDWAA